MTSFYVDAHEFYENILSFIITVRSVIGHSDDLLFRFILRRFISF